jgi:hypothetical protein
MDLTKCINIKFIILIKLIINLLIIKLINIVKLGTLTLSFR